MDDNTVSESIDPDFGFDPDDEFYPRVDYDPRDALVPEWASDGEPPDDCRSRNFEALEDYRRRFEAGNGAALLSAIAFCGQQHIPMPRWLVETFYSRWSSWNRFQSRTLDEAFGVESPKGWRFGAQRRYSHLEPFVHCYILEEKKKGRAVDESLFEDVGQRFNIAKTLVSEYYYRSQKRPYTREEMFDKKA